MNPTQKPNVPFTKERFYMDHVGGHGVPALRRHVNRYKWAASRVPQGSTVLDAGCGSGYGDHILLNKASVVDGVDASPEAIEYAWWKAQSLNETRITYHLQDLRALALPGLTFDAAVCIEVIEHVSSDDQHKIMERIKAHLKPNGHLMITTPIKGDDGAPMTEFHDHEFSREEFKAFLRKHFAAGQFDSPAEFGVPENFLLAVCQGPLS